MKHKSNLKKLYFIISVFILICAFVARPFIECSGIDIKVFRNCLLVLGSSLFIPNIINISRIKKKSLFNVFIIIVGIVLSLYIYNGHSKDYKIRNELYFKNIINIDEKVSNDSVSVSKEIDANDVILDGELLKVNFIDVGQGDSILIELPNSETMLIDAGEKNMGNRVISYIDSLGYSKINYVVGTHPHTDHIGGLESVIKKYDIDSIYMPKKDANSKTFISLLKTIKDKNLKIHTAKSGVKILDSENLDIDIIAPTKEYSDANNSSAVVKITYINKCFLFMGDAEVESEKSITDSIDCDVVKIGHHGSDTASSESFVKKTKAKYAVISVGANNIYKHPYENIVKRWESNGAEVLRTDLLGDIVISTNGNDIAINNKIVNSIDNSNSLEIVEQDINRGDNSLIKIKGEPNTNYSIKLYTKSGISKAKGLDSKLSDSEGYVSWNFKLSSNVKAGKYKFIINDQEFEYEMK